jgi:hypothetical protein
MQGGVPKGAVEGSRMAVAQRGQPTPITQALAFSMYGLSPPALAHMT